MAQTRKTAPSVLDAIKQVKKGKLLPIYYLFGEDTYSIGITASAIEEAVNPHISSDFDRDVCYSDERSLIDVIEIAKAFPFGTGKKIVILKEAEKAKDKKLLESYITSPPEFTVLVLIHNGKITNLSSSPFNLLLEGDFLYEAKELKGDYLVSWAIEIAQSKGKYLSSTNAAYLADISGGDRIVIENQLDKIITFIGDTNEITFNAIKEVTASLKEYGIFDLQNAVFQKDKASSLNIALSMLSKGEDATFIVNMITKSFIGLSQVKELHEKRIPEAEAAKIIGTHPFYLKNYQRARVLFTDTDLIKAMEALLKADVSIKTTATDSKTVITLLIAELF